MVPFLSAPCCVCLGTFTPKLPACGWESKSTWKDEVQVSVTLKRAHSVTYQCPAREIMYWRLGSVLLQAETDACVRVDSQTPLVSERMLALSLPSPGEPWVRFNLFCVNLRI